MTINLRATVVLLACAAAGAGAMGSARSAPAATGAAPSLSKARSLLEEFKASDSMLAQPQVAEKLVALRDKSVVPDLAALLKSPDRAERCNAGRVLAGLDEDRGLFAVIAELKDTAPRPARDGRIRSDGRPDVVGQTRQDRYYAALVLERIGDKRAVPALIETLKDDSLDYQAAYVLAHLRDQRAVPALLAKLRQAEAGAAPSSSTTDMRYFAAYGLMWLQHPDGLKAVARCLRADRNFIQRRHAADGLGEFGDRKAVPFLIEALKDKDVGVRVKSCMSLGRLGDRRAIPALRASSRDTGTATGSACISYGTTGPLFKTMTVHAAAVEALRMIARTNSAGAPARR